MTTTGVFTQGLRQEDVLKVAIGAAPFEWQRVMFHRLRGEFSRLGRGPGTQSAEIGLGMPPSAYWYVSRLEPDYAYIATLSEGTSLVGPALVCAFDSGGLWSEKLTLADPLSSAEAKREFLSANSWDESSFAEPFGAWISDAYPDSGDEMYARGVRPTHHSVEGIEISDDSRSWTWEVSIPSASQEEAFPPVTSLHMTEDQVEKYCAWVAGLEEISSFEAYDHQDFVDSVVSISENPYEDATARLVWG